MCYLNVPLEDAPRTADPAGPPDRRDARGWARSRGIPDEVIRLLTGRLIES